MISISQEERLRMAAYLEQEASANDDLIGQMERMESVGMKMAAQKYIEENAAYRLVARKLKSIETVSIQ